MATRTLLIFSEEAMAFLCFWYNSLPKGNTSLDGQTQAIHDWQTSCRHDVFDRAGSRLLLTPVL
jgi:hypothetical protein